jgi:hypothetical protein
MYRKAPVPDTQSEGFPLLGSEMNQPALGVLKEWNVVDGDDSRRLVSNRSFFASEGCIGMSQTKSLVSGTYAYVPSFSLIQQSLTVKTTDLESNGKITIPSVIFKEIMAEVLRRGFFDERWYLETYPDVYDAIKEGRIRSAFEHYSTTGYYEGRSPGPCEVDRNWYENHYVDVREAVKAGTIADSVEHFHQVGYSEGRAPCAEQLAEAEKWNKLLLSGR